MVHREAMPEIDKTYTGEQVVLTGLNFKAPYPLAKIYLQSEAFTGYLELAVKKDKLLIPHVQLLLGSDVTYSQVRVTPKIIPPPVLSFPEELENPEIFPICAVTRAKATHRTKFTTKDHVNPLEKLFNSVSTKEELIKAQTADSSLTSLKHLVTDDSDGTKTPRYYYKDRILMRVYRPPYLTDTDIWAETQQVVIP